MNLSDRAREISPPPQQNALVRHTLLTLPNPRKLTTSIRATAQVFQDPLSVALLERIRMVAPSEASILIFGETGTGKELIARHVHDLSQRSARPFVAVNCGAFTENLVESELFGHEKGAFTGALTAKTGWFEAANGGTLFLDEIGDLPLSIQVKLLRVLQEREIVRLGSCKSIPIDVRVIAATNIRLQDAVAAGHFREDLFYRLHVVHLALPTLQERPGDILPLAHYFIDEYHGRLGYGARKLDISAIQKLHEHSWPGNIRELENVIHHALLICQSDTICAEHLHLSPIMSRRNADRPQATLEVSPQQALIDALRGLFNDPTSQLYEKIEEAVIRTAFDFCHRNQLQTAKLLGISRNILRSRLIKNGDIAALR